MVKENENAAYHVIALENAPKVCKEIHVPANINDSFAGCIHWMCVCMNVNDHSSPEGILEINITYQYIETTIILKGLHGKHVYRCHM